MKQQPSITDWMKIDNDTRNKLRADFGIKKSGPTEVVSNVLVSDGTTNKDLEGLSLGKMIEKIGSDLPFYSEDLCDKLLFIIVSKHYGQAVDIASLFGTSQPEPEPRRRGRPKKEAQDVPGAA